MAAEVRAKVKGLRNELFSFRRDLSLQGTELQRLKDEFMERYFKHSEVELKLKMLGTKFDGLQERQLVILKDKATAAEVAALEAKLSELAGFVMPMQIASYDAMRASDPSPIPIADGMRSWLPASQAERMYDKASKSKAARQELMEQRSEGHLRDATLPPIESVTRHAKSARAAVPQAAREQRRAAFSARLEKLGVDNPVGRDE
uniref:Uncharacterized protein n=1 Tax=Tetraselmis chuii TaxID=63592 RepID=A0A7S1WZK6_9CHLO